MNTTDQGAVASTAELGPLPEPVAWFRAPYGTLEPNPLFRVTGPQSLEWAMACFTEDQLRAAVAAERERCAAAVREVAEGYRSTKWGKAAECIGDACIAAIRGA